MSDLYVVKDQGAQGELIFRRIDKLPEGLVQAPDLIVGHSESGHNHVARALGDVPVPILFHNPRDPFTGYLMVHGNKEEAGAAIEHDKPGVDQHIPFALLAGTWEIRHQRERGPDGWQMVID